MSELKYAVDKRTDLLLERVVAVPLNLVWSAWTDPEQLVKWFTPAPWSTDSAELDLRPGGIFKTVMKSPEGQLFPYTGCYLDVVPQQRLVWTTVLGPGYRPAPAGDPAAGDAFGFTCVLRLSAEGKGTRYSALVMHRDDADREKHEKMGFHDGWGSALDQLVSVFGKS
jgi:uncharacterized protein YndB with AHSA1/START domain